ncbi:DNA polymerase III subunit delta [Petroclostridium sp. X23]|uniref:DNA polymerase III subunit delta n=1 Tax=Petroclostridium sp. X23 TaxID=3045146 RepID=UPI0024ADF4E9|nr:DNA polymerase III subunit delta [Petroclostridium sp. X23]WHH60436.1 DNA polymerase III subunit delta [Petroclostridium sp. X23]
MNLSLEVFKKRLKDGSLSGIYLFCGQEDFLKDYYINQLRHAAVDETLKDFNYYYFEGKGIDLRQVEDAVESLPVMAERKLLVIKDSEIFKSPKAADKIFWENCLGDIPSYVCIAFYEKEIDKRSKLFNIIKKNGLILEFKFQKIVDLVNWVARVLKSYHKNMQKEDIYYFLQHCDAGMVGIKNEIDKLVHFAANKETISRKDIDAVCSRSVESRVFNMIDALMENKMQQAFQLLEDMKMLKEPVIKILSLLSKHYADLLKVKLLLEQGAGNEKIVSETGVPHFAVRKYIQQSYGFSIDRLHTILKECLKIDSDIKTGKINDWIALETFIVGYGVNKK